MEEPEIKESSTREKLKEPSRSFLLENLSSSIQLNNSDLIIDIYESNKKNNNLPLIHIGPNQVIQQLRHRTGLDRALDSPLTDRTFSKYLDLLGISVDDLGSIV